MGEEDFDGQTEKKLGQIRDVVSNASHKFSHDD